MIMTPLCICLVRVLLVVQSVAKVGLGKIAPLHATVKMERSAAMLMVDVTAVQRQDILAASAIKVSPSLAILQVLHSICMPF